MEREARPGPIDRGNDRHHDLRLPFRQALAGGDCHLTVSRLGRCRVCEGRGLTAVGASACAMCHGTGAVKTVRGHMVFSRACTACGGTGEARPRACRSCGGSGQAMQAETLTVRIPAGHRRRGNDPRGGPWRRRCARRARGRSVRGRPRRCGPGVHAARRRPAHADASRRARRRAWGEDRRRRAGRHGAGSRPAGHAVGPALPVQRPRRAVAAHGRTRRSRWWKHA